MGQNWATSCLPHHTQQQSPAYLLDESCCLQAAFAISHLILELLPQLLEVVCLPQNVLLVCGVLLAQLQAPPHHICTYSPVWIALCFECLAEGWEMSAQLCPVSWEQRSILQHYNTYISKSPVSYPRLWLFPEPWDDCPLAPHTEVTILRCEACNSLLWRRYLFVDQFSCLPEETNTRMHTNVY